MIKEKDKKILSDFGAHLRKLREGKGLSLRQLSYACNIDYSKISRIEKGKINITVTTIYDLSSALEVSPTQLFDFNTE